MSISRLVNLCTIKNLLSFTPPFLETHLNKMNCQICDCKTEELHKLGTYNVCKKCLVHEICVGCECLIKDSYNLYISVCRHCSEDYSCIMCGDVDEKVNGDRLCPDCEDEYTHCEWCNGLTSYDDCVNHPDQIVCEHCGRDGCVPEDSEYWYSFDELFEHQNGYWYTYEEIINGLKPYHSEERMKIEGSESGKYVGFELEVESNNDVEDDVENVRHENLYLEQDGSLSDMGFEIITKYGDINPVMELAEHIVNKLKGRCISHDADGCGLHVHLSRTKSRTTNSKMLVFWNQKSNKEFIKLFARRYDGMYCRVNGSFDEPFLRDDIYYLNDTPRYSIVRFTHNTVEVRAFRGTLKLTTLLACIELAYYSHEYCKICKGSRLHYSHFLQWLKTTDSNYIFPYLESKGKGGWIVNEEIFYPTTMV